MNTQRPRLPTYCRRVGYYLLGAFALLLTLALLPYQATVSPIEGTQATARRASLSALTSMGMFPSVQDYLRTQMAAHILGRSKLGVAWPTHHISVCWEAPDPKYVAEMTWTQRAVTTTWQAHSALTFDGWAACVDGAPGIHIKVSDEVPEALGLGTELDKETGGVILNFVMKDVVLPCTHSRQPCIETTAIHEFGHVIGLSHEDFNPHAPVFCKINASGPSGDTALTPYDPQSVMGYCTLQDGKAHEPSVLDIVSVNLLYPGT